MIQPTSAQDNSPKPPQQANWPVAAPSALPMAWTPPQQSEKRVSQRR